MNNSYELILKMQLINDKVSLPMSIWWNLLKTRLIALLLSSSFLKISKFLSLWDTQNFSQVKNQTQVWITDNRYFFLHCLPYSCSEKNIWFVAVIASIFYSSLDLEMMKTGNSLKRNFYLRKKLDCTSHDTT